MAHLEMRNRQGVNSRLASVIDRGRPIALHNARNERSFFTVIHRDRADKWPRNGCRSGYDARQGVIEATASKTLRDRERDVVPFGTVPMQL